MLLFAEDVNGKVQAWATPNEYPYARLQLTFEPEGVEPTAWVSPDGNMLAVPVLSEGTDLLLIDVKIETLADQGLVITPYSKQFN